MDQAAWIGKEEKMLVIIIIFMFHFMLLYCDDDTKICCCGTEKYVGVNTALFRNRAKMQDICTNKQLDNTVKRLLLQPLALAL